VAGVRVPVASQVGAKLRLVVHLVPDDCVGLTGGAGCSHGENEPAVPSYQEKPQNLDKEMKEEENKSFYYIIQSRDLLSTHKIRKRCFLIYLTSLLAVREVAVSGEPTGGEGFAWIWVLWALKTEIKVQHIGIIRAKT